MKQKNTKELEQCKKLETKIREVLKDQSLNIRKLSRTLKDQEMYKKVKSRKFSQRKYKENSKILKSYLTARAESKVLLRKTLARITAIQKNPDTLTKQQSKDLSDHWIKAMKKTGMTTPQIKTVALKILRGVGNEDKDKV